MIWLLYGLNNLKQCKVCNHPPFLQWRPCMTMPRIKKMNYHSPLVLSYMLSRRMMTAGTKVFSMGKPGFSLAIMWNLFLNLMHRLLTWDSSVAVAIDCTCVVVLLETLFMWLYINNFITNWIIARTYKMLIILFMLNLVPIPSF